MKYLLLVLVGVGVLWWLKRRWASPSVRAEKPNAPPHSDTAPPAEKEEVLVPCARCGVLVPKSMAREIDGRYYCCDEHRQLSAG